MIALVEYPNRKAFLEMVSRPDYLQASEHREAGLEQTVLMTTPQAGGNALAGVREQVTMAHHRPR